MALSAWIEDARDTFRETPLLGRFLAANLLSAFLTGLLLPVLPLYVLERGLDLPTLGALFTASALGAALAQVVAGRFPGSFARPGVVLALSAAPAVVFPLYTVAKSPFAFSALLTLGTVAGAAAAPGMQVLVAENVRPARQASVFAYLGSAWSLSYALALVVGGALLAVSYDAVFLVGSVVALASAGLLATVVTSSTRGLAPERRALVEAARRLRLEVVAAHRAVVRARGRVAPGPADRRSARNGRLAILYLFLFAVSLAVYPVYFPRHLVLKGLPVAWVGVVVAASWVTYAVAQPVGGRYADRTGRHRGLVLAGLAVAAALNVVMAWAPLPWVLAAWVTLGVVDGIARPVASALVVQSVDAARVAGAVGSTAAAESVARVVGPLGLAFAMVGGSIAVGLTVVAGLLLAAILPAAFIRPRAEAT